jgi:hypothetical protein
MDIFEDTCEHGSANNLEIERFKAKIKEIWSRMLEETYSINYKENDEDAPTKEEYMIHNALKFADEPEQETELDSLMDMLDGLMESDEELENVQSEGKAPTYGSSTLKSNKESGQTEATIYEFNHSNTKTPSEASSRIQGGSYAGTPSGGISKKKDDKVITKYQPLIEQLKEEIRSLEDRQRIGRRKMRFRL